MGIDPNIWPYIGSALAAGLFLGWLVSWICFNTVYRKQSHRQDLRLHAQHQHLGMAKNQLKARLAEIGQLKGQNRELTRVLSAARAQLAAVKTAAQKDRQTAEEKIALLRELREDLTTTYQAVASQALKDNNRSFVDLADAAFSRQLESAAKEMSAHQKAVKHIMGPVEAALDQYKREVRDMERAREHAYGSLTRQLTALSEAQLSLQQETGRLGRALGNPQVRGRWGEMTLRRTVELAGMSKWCDFREQPPVADNQRLLRPDMVVSLPEERNIVIDAKVPLKAYLDAIDALDESRRGKHLKQHAAQLRSHIQALSKKAYWAQFSPTPEFVILFIPGDAFLVTALDQDPELIELGTRQQVMLATPTTLIPLLKTIAFAWRTATATENAEAISQMGAELYDRLFKLTSHVADLGKALERCTSQYNKLVGSWERRALPSAEQLRQLGAGGKHTDTLAAPARIVTAPRRPSHYSENTENTSVET